MTGVQGFIGAALAHAAAAQGDEVIGVDRSAQGRALPGELELIEGDITDPGRWRTAFDGVDVVMHSAAVHRASEVEGDPIRSIEVNLLGTRLMLETAADAGVPCFVYLSSAKAYGEPQSFPSTEDDLLTPVEPYGLAKALGEEYCKHYAARGSMRCVSVRPFSVYGPGQDLSTGYIGQLIEAWLWSRSATLSGRPDFLRDFVHIDDVVDVCLAAARDSRGYDVVNAGSGQATSLRDLVRHFTALCGDRVDSRFSPARPGTIECTLADVRRTREFLGRPPIPLVPGLRETLEWFGARRNISA